MTGRLAPEFHGSREHIPDLSRRPPYDAKYAVENETQRFSGCGPDESQRRLEHALPEVFPLLPEHIPPDVLHGGGKAADCLFWKGFFDECILPPFVEKDERETG
jgi:hypothetical protein